MKEDDKTQSTSDKDYVEYFLRGQNVFDELQQLLSEVVEIVVDEDEFTIRFHGPEGHDMEDMCQITSQWSKFWYGIDYENWPEDHVTRWNGYVAEHIGTDTSQLIMIVEVWGKPHTKLTPGHYNMVRAVIDTICDKHNVKKIYRWGFDDGGWAILDRAGTAQHWSYESRHGEVMVDHDTFGVLHEGQIWQMAKMGACGGWG